MSREGAQIVVTNEGAAPGVVIADAVVFAPVPPGKKQASFQGQDPGARPDEADRKARLEQLEARQKELTRTQGRRPQAMAVADRDKVGDVHVAIRGVVHNRGKRVPRGVLTVASRHHPSGAMPKDASGRLELARWVAHADNPLTARVFVNRVWYWLFGEGLVPSVDNFGAMGSSPSHPELLDHLASEFVQQGWSVKWLVRTLVLSRVYQLASHGDAPAADPENRLWWKARRKRMEAESVRDTLLAIAEELDEEVGGSHIRPGTKIEYGYRFDSARRSVYLPVFRNTLPEILAAFDFADPNVQGGKRTSSTIAPQALLLMNDPFVIQQTRRAAEQLVSREQDLAARIARSYQLVLGRDPTGQEFRLAEAFLDGRADATRLALLIQTLVQSLDFRYIH